MPKMDKIRIAEILSAPEVTAEMLNERINRVFEVGADQVTAEEIDEIFGSNLEGETTKNQNLIPH